MKIISWNVNGIRACSKKGLADFIAMQKPEIFGIQETKAHRSQVEFELQTLGYQNVHWSSAERKGYSGVATFSNVQPKKITETIGYQEYQNEGRIVVTDYDDFLLYNIYFPNGGSGQERHDFKQVFLSRLFIHLRDSYKSGRQVIVMGDYNIAHKEIDVYDPIRLSKTSGFLPEERKWFGEFLDLGFVDTFRFVHGPVANRFSWWSYRELARETNRGWRIDFICVTKELRARITNADILDQVEGSDHCPVLLELN